MALNSETLLKQTDLLAFQAMGRKVAEHPASGHGVFAHVASLAKNRTLAAEQVDIFTRAMMARIFMTMPNIAGLVEKALVMGNDELAKTAMMNLTEEMGEGGKSHQKLAEEAFNALRTGFGLAAVTMKQAHDSMPLPESYVQEQLWQSGYRDFPAIASWLQERASGGMGDNRKGMMADMFEVFEACRNIMGDDVFCNQVLPYFKAHNTVEKVGNIFRIRFDREGVEFQHGQRAEQDAKMEFCALKDEDKRRVEVMAKAFLDVQADLFSAIDMRMGGFKR